MRKVPVIMEPTLALCGKFHVNPFCVCEHELAWDETSNILEFAMQKLIFAVSVFIALGAVVISGSLFAGHQKPTKTVTAEMNPTALTLASKDLPVVQVNEPF